ncbi:cytochrome P450 [Amycolatopsis speibonae]|uniref:Cytochrome P450 n=1 Tax=Amycolatopsis speibonae TaxID=1450224 RepID=A0ABV7NVG8_9PSEU
MDQVPGGRQVTFDHLPALVYTGQVVSEVLRMYALSILMRRTEQEIDLGPVRLRPGDEVMFSPLALHADPRSWDHPDLFDPDRWATDRVRSLPPGVFIPFGGGNRECVGHLFARAEVVVGPATIFARWRLEPAGPVRVRYTTIACPRGMPMTVRPRD